MITTPDVTHLATKIDDGRRRKWAFLHNQENYTIYVKFDGSETALTVANGMPIGPGQTFTLGNAPMETEFFHDIYAIHDQGSEVTGNLRIHQNEE